VTTLVNAKGSTGHQKGKSKRGPVLVQTVERATADFVTKGEQIASANLDMRNELLAAVDEVRKTGEIMSVASKEFVNDPCTTTKRANMVRAARNLLSAVARLLILADEVDVRKLLKSLHVVSVSCGKSPSEFTKF
jgi:catenin alpha